MCVGIGSLCILRFGDPRRGFSLETEMAGRCLMKAQSQQVKETYTNVFLDDCVSVAVSFP